jgi:sulfite exporter TauE/SafE
VALSVLISAWLVGALGALHCLAMCGGLLGALAARDLAVQPLLPARALALRQVAYHAGRVATYAALGSAFGAAGAYALRAADLLPLQRALYLAANGLLLVLGISIALRTPGVAWLQRLGTRGFSVILPLLQPLLRRPGMAGSIASGMVWGLLPCALVYSVLPLAVMLAFGLGTVPNLLAGALLLGRARRVLEGRPLRYAAAALLIGFAVAGFWRVLFDPGALAQGPFCLVP